MAMKYAVISCSLNSGSRSRLMAETAFTALKALGVQADFVDLAKLPLPICDGGTAYGDTNAGALKERLQEVDGFVLAAPVYNFDVNAAAKNLIELTGKDVWADKVVGFLCAAGGASSYMAVMGIANSLMLDFRTTVVPRFVYAQGDGFDESSVSDPALRERIGALAGEVVRYATGLRGGG